MFYLKINVRYIYIFFLFNSHFYVFKYIYTNVYKYMYRVLTQSLQTICEGRTYEISYLPSLSHNITYFGLSIFSYKYFGILHGCL